jgi:hypothetical protein
MKEWMWVAGLENWMEHGDAALNLIFGILAMAGNEMKNEVAVTQQHQLSIGQRQ